MTTKPKTDVPPKEPREMLDGTKPFVVMLHQTPSRDNYRIFEGDDQSTEAVDAATVIAGRGGAAFVLLPVQIFTPPKEPIVEVAALNFNPSTAPVGGEA